jgi:RNA polymerase sigma-70 factor, ECF subfamily
VTSRDSMERDFHEFVASRSGALLRTAYLLAGDWATAEDLLQTALTKTYLAWKRLGHIDAVEPYARRVLVNTATSWWRRRWHGERPTESLPEQAGPDLIQEQLERDVLWRHVKALPARQRAVLVLRFYEDLSEAQTAALLDISPGTVKSQTSRALGTLRKRLAAAGLAPTSLPVTPRVLRASSVLRTAGGQPATGGPAHPDGGSPMSPVAGGPGSAATGEPAPPDRHDVPLPAGTGAMLPGQSRPTATLPGSCILPIPAYAGSGVAKR